MYWGIKHILFFLEKQSMTEEWYRTSKPFNLQRYSTSLAFSLFSSSPVSPLGDDCVCHWENHYESCTCKNERCNQLLYLLLTSKAWSLVKVESVGMKMFTSSSLFADLIETDSFRAIRSSNPHSLSWNISKFNIRVVCSVLCLSCVVHTPNWTGI